MLPYLDAYARTPPYHPLLLVGEGALPIAKSLFKEINHEKSTDDHEDMQVFELGDKTTWGVGSTRELVDSISRPPLAVNHRVIIWDQIDKLTPEASDAFLKAVEECAPFNVFIFLTTAMGEVIPALKSRCWTVNIAKELEIEKTRSEWEPSLIFIESFIEPGALIKSLALKDTDIENLLSWSIFVLAKYLEGAPVIQQRLKTLTAEKTVRIYQHLNELYTRIKTYPSIRAYDHLFQTVIQIGKES
jgi:hypothetical protein